MAAGAELAVSAIRAVASYPPVLRLPRDEAAVDRLSHPIRGHQADGRSRIRRGAAIDEVETVLQEAAHAGVNDVLRSDALLIATSENFGSLSGMVKDFFERRFTLRRQSRRQALQRARLRQQRRRRRDGYRSHRHGLASVQGAPRPRLQERSHRAAACTCRKRRSRGAEIGGTLAGALRPESSVGPR